MMGREITLGMYCMRCSDMQTVYAYLNLNTEDDSIIIIVEPIGAIDFRTGDAGLTEFVHRCGGPVKFISPYFSLNTKCKLVPQSPIGMPSNPRQREASRRGVAI